jgi:hypothetical protein
MYKLQFPANPTLVFPSLCCCCGRDKTDGVYTMNIAHTTSMRRDARIYNVSVVSFPMCNECQKWINCRLTSIKVYAVFWAFMGLIAFTFVCLAIFLPIEALPRLMTLIFMAAIFFVIFLLFSIVRNMLANHINKGKPNDKCKTPPVFCCDTDANSFTLGFENTNYAQNLLILNKQLTQQEN